MLKKQTLWPLFMDGVQLPQGYSHFEEAVYFLTLLCIEIPGTDFIDLGRMKGWVDPGATQWFLDTRPLHWKSSALTTRPLLQGLLFIFLACVSFQKGKVVKNWTGKKYSFGSKVYNQWFFKNISNINLVTVIMEILLIFPKKRFSLYN